MKLLVLTMDNYQDIELVSFIGTINASGKIEKITYWNPNGQSIVVGVHKIGSINTISGDININDYDAIFIPGGRACIDLRKNKNGIEMIKKFINNNKYIFAICDAPNVIAEANLLPNKKYVSYPIEDIDKNATEYRIQNDKTCADGKYITGNCPNSSIEFGLRVIKELYGDDLKNAVKNRLTGGIY